METWQIAHIHRNLNPLISNTNCNSTVFAILQERNVLSNGDYSRLEAKGKSEGRIEQSKLLYEIVQTRTGAYDALIEALRETVQTGSLKILEQGAEDLEFERGQELMGKLRWIPSSAASSRLSELIPAGREDLTSYIARAFHEGEWISGKFLICFDGVYRAYIPYYGKEYTYTDFQTLIAPPGATTWVETGPKNIPKHAVVGGFDPAVMEPTYICRAWHEGQLVVGKVLRNSENCFIPFHGKELLIDKRFEVLVYNFNEAKIENLMHQMCS